MIKFKKRKKQKNNEDDLAELLYKGNYYSIIEKFDEKSNCSDVSLKIFLTAKKMIEYIEVLNDIVTPNNSERMFLSDRKHHLENSIIKVVESQIKTSKVAAEVKLALENERNKLIQEDWVKSQYANIISKIQGVKNIAELGSIVLTELAFATDSVIGAFYSASIGTDDGDSTLNVVGSFGFDQKNCKMKFNFGEGFVGQTAKDRRARFVKNISDSIQIFETGVGVCKPKSLIVIPVQFEGSLYGVLELLSLNDFSEIQLKLIEQIANNIGISIRNMSSNLITQNLLNEIAEKNSSLASQKQALDSAAIVAETDNRGKITYVNEKFIELSKYSREELIGQDHKILNSGFHPKEFFINLWKTIAKGDVWHGEVKNKAKDGTFYWVDTTIYPVLDESKTFKKYVAIRFDITDKKKALEELQYANEQAKNAAKIKTEFLANMSHEIRTPMNAIIGMSELLKDTYLNTEQERFVNTLNNAGNVLLDIINNILDISKIESGKMELEMIPFNLEDTVYDSVEIMSKTAYGKGLELIVKIENKINTNLLGDSIRLRQVLINLLRLNYFA